MDAGGRLMSLIMAASGRRRNRPLTIPRFTEHPPLPDIPIGAAGSWEQTDVNNPNVVWDAASSRWVMYYTGYSNQPTDDGNQDMGVAYADTLDGPWVKDPLNPVFTDTAAGAWSQNGGLEKVGGTWVLAYNAATGREVWLATSPDLHTWTKLSTKFFGGDPFLRIHQDTGALECYYWINDADGRNIYRRTSTDAGATWSAAVHILPPAPIVQTMVNGGEPSVFVPPGHEGRIMFVAVDSYPDRSLVAGRGTVLAVTEDGGATWTWHPNYWLKSGSGWDAMSVFDTFFAYERGRLYLFYAGTSVADTGTLNMGIQIGHTSVEWAPPSP